MQQFRGRARQWWGELTNDDLGQIGGRRDQLWGALQARYGMTKEAVEDQVRVFDSDCDCL